jgi:hypothetical protein
VKELPNDFISTKKSLSDTRESLVLTSGMLQKDLETKRLETQEFGEAVWKGIYIYICIHLYIHLNMFLYL